MDESSVRVASVQGELRMHSARKTDRVCVCVYILRVNPSVTMTVATRQTDFFHFTLVMLERYVRKPLEGTVVDEYLFLPAKLLYRQSKKED